jgi:hypothetical protein
MKRLSLIILFYLLFLEFGTAQNVGIGTPTPSRAKLEVHGAVGLTSAIFGGEGQGISLLRSIPGVAYNSYFSNGLKLLQDGTAALQYFNPANGSMSFDMTLAGTKDQSPSGSRRVMSLYNNGSVCIGINSTALGASLTVERGAGGDGTAVFEGTTHRSHFNFGFGENTYIRAGKDQGKVIINDIPFGKVSMWGKVGINTPEPYFPLEVWQTEDKGIKLVSGAYDWEHRISGALGWLYLFYNGSYVGKFEHDGDYTHVSDGRLKKNITPIPTVLDNIMELQPVKYEMKYNNPENEKSIGFIAQDVKTIFPELVHITRDTATGYKDVTDVHTISYNGFGVLAIKAIQEQQLMIRALQAEVDLLRTLIIGQKEKYLTINQ